MINHARTLLMNKAGARRPGLGFPGEEYVPSDFVALTLPKGVRTYHQVLFGSIADNLFVNQRIAQLLTLVQTAEDYADWLLTFDPRVTYTAEYPSSLATYQFESSLRRTDIGVGPAPAITSAPFRIVGAESANAQLGQARRMLVLQLDSDMGGTYLYFGDSKVADPIELTFSNDVSQLVSVPKSANKLQVIKTSDYACPSTWIRVDEFKLTDGVADLLARLKAVESSNEQAVFGSHAVEPYKTFYGLWRYHYSPAHQILGLVCAMVHRMEAIRVG